MFDHLYNMKTPECVCISKGRWLINGAAATRQPDMTWYHLGTSYPTLSDVVGMWMKEFNNG